MSAMRELWSDPVFLEAIQKMQEVQPVDESKASAPSSAPYAQGLVAASSPAAAASDKPAGADHAQDVEPEPAARRAAANGDQARIKDRLASLIGPYKKAVAEHVPEEQRLKALVGSITSSVGQKRFAEASQSLDTLEQLLSKPNDAGPKFAGAIDAGAAPVAPAGPAVVAPSLMSAAPTGSGGGSGGAGQGGSAPSGRSARTVRDIVGPVKFDPPDATSSVLFFNEDSAELTASDKKSLEAYVKAYQATKPLGEFIFVKGYASMDGNEAENKKLSQRRADAVADYLRKRGVGIADASGLGQTDNYGSDLRWNRCATLYPPPETWAPKPETQLTVPEIPDDIRNLKIPDPPKDEDDLTGLDGLSSPPGAEWTVDLVYAFVPTTYHESTGGQKTHDRPAQQFQVNVNVQIDKVTFTWVACQLTVFRDSNGQQKYEIQNIMTGGQASIEAYAHKFLKGMLELDLVAQALGGESRQEIKGSMKLVPTVQEQVGGQVQYKFKVGKKMKLVIIAQVAVGGTAPRGTDTTGDMTAQLGLAVEF